MVAPDATDPLNAGDPRLDTTLLGNVTSAEPSDAVFAVFEMTSFTDPYDVFVQSVWAPAVPATGADGLLTAPLCGNSMV
jgi:hypothetical protein